MLNCNTLAETPALKDNSGSKLNSNISKNVSKFSDSSSHRIHWSLINQFMKCHLSQIKDLPFVAMIMSETRCLTLL